MTVGELIAELERWPKDTPVLIQAAEMYAGYADASVIAETATQPDAIVIADC